MKVLIVDDEVSILDLLKMTLDLKGFKSFTARTGSEALSFLLSNDVDAVLLDAILPDTDGFSLISKIKEIGDIPIIMLTGKSDINDKLLGLSLGADDYITKPFNISELILRLEVVKKHTFNSKDIAPPSNVLTVGPLNLNIDEQLLYINKDVINLTFKEFKVLEYLFSNPGKVFTRDELLEKIWGYDFEGTSRAVDILIQRLRKKLGDYQHYIQTIYGAGYKLNNILK